MANEFAVHSARMRGDRVRRGNEPDSGDGFQRGLCRSATPFQRRATRRARRNRRHGKLSGSPQPRLSRRLAGIIPTTIEALTHPIVRTRRGDRWPRRGRVAGSASSIGFDEVQYPAQGRLETRRRILDRCPILRLCCRLEGLAERRKFVGTDGAGRGFQRVGRRPDVVG